MGDDTPSAEPSLGISTVPPQPQWGGAYGPVGYDDPAFQQYLPSEGVAGPLAQENSDAYWNSLIDGESILKIRRIGLIPRQVSLEVAEEPSTLIDLMTCYSG
jgi:hypothetical protein